MLWLSYDKLIQADDSGVISRSLIGMFAKKNVFLTDRIEHLSQRSLREKVLSYLKEQAVKAGDNSFTISLDRGGNGRLSCRLTEVRSQAMPWQTGKGKELESIIRTFYFVRISLLLNLLFEYKTGGNAHDDRKYYGLS